MTKHDRTKRTAVIRVYNSSRQLLQLQMRAPGGDFFTNESQVRINPGQEALLPKSHVRKDQITNLTKKGFIKILHDSEAVADREATLASL